MWTPMVNWLARAGIAAKAAELQPVGVGRPPADLGQQLRSGRRRSSKVYLDAAGGLWVQVVFARVRGAGRRASTMTTATAGRRSTPRSPAPSVTGGARQQADRPTTARRSSTPTALSKEVDHEPQRALLEDRGPGRALHRPALRGARAGHHPVSVRGAAARGRAEKRPPGRARRRETLRACATLALAGAAGAVAGGTHRRRPCRRGTWSGRRGRPTMPPAARSTA